MTIPDVGAMKLDMVDTGEMLTLEKPEEFTKSDICNLTDLIAEQLESPEPFYSQGGKDYPIHLHVVDGFEGLTVHFFSEEPPAAENITKVIFTNAYFQKDRESVVLVDAEEQNFLTIY